MPADNSIYLRERLTAILWRHVHDEADAKLSDREFIRAVIARWEKYLKEEIVDVGE